MRIARTTVLLLSFLAIPTGLLAQSTPIKVKVSAEEDSESREVARDIQGRIGSTSRYALVSYESPKILVSINCLPVGQAGTTVACSGELTFWPLETTGLSTELTSAMVLGNTEFAAKSLFDHFVTETTDENLRAATERFTSFVNTIKTYAYGEGYTLGAMRACEGGNAKPKPGSKPQ